MALNIIHVDNFFMSENGIAALTEALAAAVQEFGDVIRDVTNPFFKSTYADLSNHIEATRSPLGKHGLVLLQAPGMNEAGPNVTTMLSHASGELIGFTFPIPASKLDAQGIGSALTYNRRYSQAPILNIAGEYDDDANAAVASRREHLEKLDQQMAGQERISAVMVKTFEQTAADHGRTQEQIKQFLDDLNGYVQVIEIQKRDWDKAKAWALNQPKDDDLVGDLATSLQQAYFRKIHAIAREKKVSDADLHRMIEENFHKKSTKELTQKQFEQLTQFLENVTPAG